MAFVTVRGGLPIFVDSTAHISYAVVIKTPKNPNYYIMNERLKSYKYATPLAGQPVLISTNDTEAMTEEEKKIEHECEHEMLGEYEEDLKTQMNAAMTTIFGEQHGLRLSAFYAGCSGIIPELGYIEPVMLLEHTKSCVADEELDFAAIKTLPLSFPDMENTSEIDANFAKVLDEFGLETLGKPGWQLVFTVSTSVATKMARRYKAPPAASVNPCSDATTAKKQKKSH